MEATRSATDAIEALLATIGDAFNRGDSELFASAHTEDADFSNIRANELRGRAEIDEHHRTLFSTIYRGATLRREGLRVSLIRPDVALVELRSVARAGELERHAHMLAVAVDGPEGWKLRAVHNMIPFEVAPSATTD
jgi:uncharacterized protein (TIGR02246 family)